MTLIEQLLARAADKAVVFPGDYVVCEVDMTVLIDLQFADQAFIPPLAALHDRHRVAIVMDHATPAPTIRDASAGVRARSFAERFGVENFYDVGHHGIVHQVVAEAGLALPGQVLACVDSHTCASGALNVAGRGLGSAEIVSILCTGKTWYRVPETVHFELNGRLPTLVSGKDLFLDLAHRFGEAFDRAWEFGGPGLAHLPMSDRRTVATQGAEVGADFCVFPGDALCREYVAARTARPFHAVECLPDAQPAESHEIELDRVEPMVALPGSVINNGMAVTQLGKIRVDQCFIGSCANGQLEDLAEAARVLRGRRVASGTRLIVTPASQRVWIEATRQGLLADLAEAGAVVTNSTCGACCGYHMGVLGPGEVCLTSSTRNFKGRMGSPDAEIYMASPATVAASAVTGYTIDPRELAA